MTPTDAVWERLRNIRAREMARRNAWDKFEDSIADNVTIEAPWTAEKWAAEMMWRLDALEAMCAPPR